MLGIEGGYAAYCFDVAGSIYLSYLERGKKPLAWEETINDIL